MKRFIEKYEGAIAAALFILGFALRLAYLGSLPMGLNQDEASTGYEAWSLLNYGIDRCGNSWPVLLESWGSGQNVLYSILAMPFIAVFGLNVYSLRIVAGIFGCGALAVFWLMARRCGGKGFGITALFFLAVNPWHIMASRWALESNLLPFFLLTGVYFTSLARQKGWALLGAAISFALALYAYGTAYFFLPLYLVCAVIWLRRRLMPGSFLVSLAVFMLMAMPITVCQLINALGGNEVTVLGITITKLTQSRQSATSVLGGGGFSAAMDNFRSFLKLLWHQSDGLVFNSLGKGGIYYIFGLPLAILGVLVALGDRKKRPEEAPMLFALLASVVSAFFIDVNINRINMAWLPLVYFASLGLYIILCKVGKFAAVPVAAVLLCFVIFVGNYVETLKTHPSELYYPGLGEAIEYCGEQGAESVFITNYVNQPYIFALFYSKTPTPEFIETVDYINPGAAFQWVRSFGKYRFGPAQDAQGDYVILHMGENTGLAEIAYFGSYVVCRGYGY